MVFTEIEYGPNWQYFVYKGTVIDKAGKDVFKKLYTIAMPIEEWGSFETYPQKGPYLCFQEPVTIKNRTYKRASGTQFTETFTGYASGLAGTKGVLIKPTYTGGIATLANRSENLVIPSQFQIITKQKKILTTKEINTKVEFGAGYGVIDFAGKTFIPFEEIELVYNEKENTFSGPSRIYTTAGKKINFDSFVYNFVNGYIKAAKQGAYNNKEGYSPTTYYYVKPDGTSFNISKKFGWNDKTDYDLSDFSVGGYAWVQNKTATKYGLIDFTGKTILKFEYDTVDYRRWTDEKYGYAIVEKNGKKGLVNAKGKLVIPCSYTHISSISLDERIDAIVKVGNSNNKAGLAEINTGKFLLKCEYDSIGAFTGNRQVRRTFFEMGVYCVTKDGKTVFLDKNGKEVYSTKYIQISEGLNGLFVAEDGMRDNRGRMIFPRGLNNPVYLESPESYTIFVKNGKVYRASAIYFDKTFEYKAKGAKAADVTAFKKKMSKEYDDAYQKALSNPGTKAIRNSEPYIILLWPPDKLQYFVGETFVTKGIKVYDCDIYGYAINIADDIVYKIGKKTINDGYKFTEEGSFTVD